MVYFYAAPVVDFYSAVDSLVFGNDRRVPERWLEKYGGLASDVAFYFLSDDGVLEDLGRDDDDH